MEEVKKDTEDQFFIIGNFKNTYLKIEGVEPVKIDFVRGKVAFFYAKSDELFVALDKYKNDLEYQRIVNAYKMVSNQVYEFKKANRER